MWQQPCEQPTPRPPPLIIGEQVLAEFDRNVRQVATLTMHWDGLVCRISHAVELVVAGDESLFAFQQRPEEMSEARIAIVSTPACQGRSMPLKTGVSSLSPSRTSSRIFRNGLFARTRASGDI